MDLVIPNVMCVLSKRKLSALVTYSYEYSLVNNWIGLRLNIAKRLDNIDLFYY